MKRVSTFIAVVAATFLSLGTASADEFTIEFEWGDTPHCNTGNPSRIPNPVFTLANVPEGTTVIKFKMRDLDAPLYNHGGGKVAYHGTDTIDAGAFTYKGPCPPRTTHKYRWIATAVDADGDEVGKTSATRPFPE